LPAHFSGMGLSIEKTCALFYFIARKKKKNEWVKQWLQKMDTLWYMTLNAELRVSSDVDLINYLRKTNECFKVLFHLLKPHIEKWNTRIKRAISAEEGLAATLQFLVTRRSSHGLKFTAFIPSVCWKDSS
jgi:hypothetical protein